MNTHTFWQICKKNLRSGTPRGFPPLLSHHPRLPWPLSATNITSSHQAVVPCRRVLEPSYLVEAALVLSIHEAMWIEAATDGIIGLVSPKVGNAESWHDHVGSDIPSPVQLVTKAENEGMARGWGDGDGGDDGQKRFCNSWPSTWCWTTTSSILVRGCVILSVGLGARQEREKDIRGRSGN